MNRDHLKVEKHWPCILCRGQNGMLRNALEGTVILISLQHLIALALDYCPACKPEVWGIVIRVVKNNTSTAWNLLVLLESDIIRLVGKYLVLGNFSGQNTFSKIVSLIVQEAKLDLRSTKYFLELAVLGISNKQDKFGSELLDHKNFCWSQDVLHEDACTRCSAWRCPAWKDLFRKVQFNKNLTDHVTHFTKTILSLI